MARQSKAATEEAAKRVAAVMALSEDDAWTCTATVQDADGSVQVCDRHDQHNPDPAINGHWWRQVDDARPAEPGSIGAQLLGPGAIETPVRSRPDSKTELVPVASNGRGQKYADLTSIVEVAETLRFDAHTTVGLETELDAASDLLALARAQEANREVVDPATIRQLTEHHDRFGRQLKSWQLQRGIKDNGGGQP